MERGEEGGRVREEKNEGEGGVEGKRGEEEEGEGEEGEEQGAIPNGANEHAK